LDAGRRIGALVATLLVIAAAIAASAWGQPESWPMLQGGPSHVGDATGAVAPPLVREWRSKPSDDERVGSLAVVSGLAVGVARTQVIAWDPSTGQVRWTVDRANGPISGPAVDPSLGSGGVLVFTEGDRPGKSALVGLDLATQDRLWSLPLGDLVRGMPTLDAGRVYVGARDAFVYAADAATGKLVWKVKTSGAVDATPAAAEGKVFVVSEVETVGDVTLTALDASTGRLQWSFDQPRPVLGPTSATVADGVVYVGFGDPVVRAFDAATGALQWSRLVRASFSYRSSLAFAGGSVYTLDTAGGVYRLDARTGERVWEYRFPADVSWSSPLVVGGYVYVGLDDGTVAAVDVPRGHLVWEAVVGGAIGGLAPAGDLLLAPRATGGGGLLAFAHDPGGVLIDEPSPTVLNLPVALANFAGAFLVLTVLLIALFRFAFRSRHSPVPGGRDVEVAEP
jgi:outer membrane protein assembly factor BamB